MLKRVVLALILALTSLSAQHLDCEGYKAVVLAKSLEVQAIGTTFTLPQASSSAIITTYGWPDKFVIILFNDIAIATMIHTGMLTDTIKVFKCKELP